MFHIKVLALFLLQFIILCSILVYDRGTMVGVASPSLKCDFLTGLIAFNCLFAIY
jgi:hypothetical protein